MIRVIDDLFIDIDENNYTVKRDKHTTTIDKNGIEKQNYDSIGYYSTFLGALQGIRNYCIRKSLCNRDMTLNEAIKAINDVNDEFIELIHETIKEKS